MWLLTFLGNAEVFCLCTTLGVVCVSSLLGIGSICESTATLETSGYIPSCLLYFIVQSCHMVIEAAQIVTGLNTIV